MEETWRKILNVTTTEPQTQVNVIHTFPKDLTVDKLHMPVFLTVVMSVAAILFVCLFTLCLLGVVKRQGSGSRQDRQASSDYETMMPGVVTEPELCCTCPGPDYADLSTLPTPPPDLCPHFASKARDSVLSSHCEYVNMDESGHNCQYEPLDCSQMEDHVYVRLHENTSPKDGQPGVKK